MILDTPGQKGGGLYSRKSYVLNKDFGDSLVQRGRAINYEPKRMITIHTTEGKTETKSWGEYLKERKSRSKL